MQVEFHEELGDHGRYRLEGQIGIIAHRRLVSAERQLRDDAAVAISQAGDELVPQAPVHQHSVQQHYDGSIATGVRVREAGSRGLMESHLRFLHPGHRARPFPGPTEPSHPRARRAESRRTARRSGPHAEPGRA